MLRLALTSAPCFQHSFVPRRNPLVVDLHPDTATSSFEAKRRSLDVVRSRTYVEPRHKLPIDVSVTKMQWESVKSNGDALREQPVLRVAITIGVVAMIIVG